MHHDYQFLDQVVSLATYTKWKFQGFEIEQKKLSQYIDIVMNKPSTAPCTLMRFNIFHISSFSGTKQNYHFSVIQNFHLNCYSLSQMLKSGLQVWTSFAQIVHLFFTMMKLTRQNSGIFLPFMPGWTMILVMFKVNFSKLHSFKNCLAQQFKIFILVLIILLWQG